MPPRAGNVSLNSQRLFEELGTTPLDPWPFYQEHVPSHRNWHLERPAGEYGSPTFFGGGALSQSFGYPDEFQIVIRPSHSASYLADSLR